VVLVIFSAAAASAQPLADPNFLEFTVSADHDAVDENGQPLVLRYDLFLYVIGATSPQRVVSIGKPTPDAAGAVRIALGAILSPLPVGGTTYEMRIAAVGPGGSAESAPSNDFTFQLPCTYGVSPGSRALAAAGGTNSFSVEAPIGCPWTASEASDWIAISSGVVGSGAGTVTFTVNANTSTASRSTQMTIAGQTVEVDQSGAITCSYSVAPGNRALGAAGGTSSFSVTAPAGCTWTASDNVSWVTITGGASGNGDGTVTFTVASNSAIAARNTSLTIAGQTVTVDQAAAACTYGVSPGSRSMAVAGGTSTFSVTAPAGCTWTATENVDWITITGGAAGSGNGTVTFNVASNSVRSTRSATLTIAGKSATVSQAAAPCTYTVSPAAQSVVRSGGNVTFNVATQSGCSWSASEQSSWITIGTGATGTGNGSTTFVVSAYTGTQGRTASATVAGRTITLSQSAGAPPAAPTGFRIVGQ
jgi:all-beta uncharacterized protein/BACON domain-containing protein